MTMPPIMRLDTNKPTNVMELKQIESGATAQFIVSYGD